MQKLAKRITILFLLSLWLMSGALAEIYYPWKNVYIGALDADSWVGLVFVPHPDCAFAFRIRIKRGEELTEGEDLFFLVSEVGPHSPDGQYARLKLDLGLPFGEKEDTPILKKPSPRSDTLVFEWSRQDERIALGRIFAPANIEIQLIHYFPWDYNGEYRVLEDGQVGAVNSEGRKFHYRLWTDRTGRVGNESGVSELIVPFPMEKNNAVYFVGGIGEEENILEDQMYRYKNSGLIDSILKEEEDRYDKIRVKISGFYRGVAESITNNLFWMLLYQRGEGRLYTPAGRRWIFPRQDQSPDHWTIFEWDSFFNALEVSIESFKQAGDIVRSVLETQYPNGNIPNWRGRFGGTPDRSQPPVGAYVVLKLFLKNGDTRFLEYAYPYLKRWHAFWKAKKGSNQARRDGNGDGLLEWGSDTDMTAENVPSWEVGATGEKRAGWESGQDDLPNWDGVEFSERSNTLVLNSLDLNCLYTLDAYCLSQIANILDIKEEYEDYLDEYETMKQLVDDYFWDEKEGFYFDRYWNGTFSTRKAASNFYPLLARIPDQRKAMRMVRHLLNDQEFWGDFVIPTISRDDPAFGGDLQYWRGSIWPPTNYLVYQGLKTYRFDTVAAELAKKSAGLFLRTWENFQLCPENFDSRTGEAAGKRHQSWGPLFSLIALEEYMDITPWEGFRFGMISPEVSGRLSRISIQGRHYDVEVSKQHIKLFEEGNKILQTNAGAVFRRFIYQENEISFEINSLKQIKVEIDFLMKGKYQLLIDGQDQGTFKGGSTKLKIPEGEHSVLILLLERRD